MAKFILVKHEALKRGLHYDLRFQMPNSKNWASFALNELPPSEFGKRIYVPRTTDHSEKEALFIGTIPEGEYGAGKLTKVELGNCDVIKFTNAHIIVNFKGKKISGTYHFINAGLFGRKRNFKQKVYAFFKAKSLVESYLKILYYNIKNIVHEYNDSKLPEKNNVFKKRVSSEFIWLYHGTRAKDDIIKNDGLKLNKANRYGFEEEKYGKFISFTSSKKYAKFYTTGLINKTSILLCKLETKFLKFGYNSKGFDEYIYFKDVPSKNIFFPNDKKYLDIENNQNYLEK